MPYADRRAVAQDGYMRDREVIDSELRLVAAVRQVVVETGVRAPAIAVVDELLDERITVCGATNSGH